jgi:hypothetical protein
MPFLNIQVTSQERKHFSSIKARMKVRNKTFFYLLLSKQEFYIRLYCDVGRTSQYSKQSPLLIRNPDNPSPVNRESTAH